MVKEKYIPEVIQKVVKNDLCTGCGLCVTECSTKLEMGWNPEGFLVPKEIENCENNGNCIKVCPFNPKPIEEVKDEDSINKSLGRKNLLQDDIIGPYLGIYAGHSEKFRESSSSGGIVTYILTEMFLNNDINKIISVRYSESNSIYEYSVSQDIREIRNTSKTKYYPVTLSKVLTLIEKEEGKYAITGIPCFIKGIRLKQHLNPIYKKRIVFLVGIFCGGLKGKLFTEYLAEKTDFNFTRKQNLKPLYRYKKPESLGASDYSFALEKDNNIIAEVKMKSLHEMWGSGLFKANACDFCDDLCAETSDLSVGDAWIKPYVDDYKGDNIIITRSPLAERYIKKGQREGKLQIQVITSQKVKLSQHGNINHRRKGLALRLFLYHRILTKQNKTRANTRIKASPFHGISFWIVQLFRIKIRKLSIDNWKQSKDIIDFEQKMKLPLNRLKMVTKVHQFIRKFYLKNILLKLKTLKND